VQRDVIPPPLKKTVMGIVIKRQEFDLPVEGLYNAVISRIEDLGVVETKSGAKDKARIFFTMLDQKGENGSNVDAFLSVNKVLDEGNLGTLLKSLKISYGRELDLDTLIGVKCQVVIQHNEKNGHAPEAQVVAVLRLPPRSL
jgi:hypothetical protein